MASLRQIFGVFAKIGAFTIGGGYAMIPLIRDELTTRGWISDEELPDIIALAQSAPGVLAVNVSIFTGYRLRGLKGSIAATLGTILPSFVAILLIAMVFRGYADHPVVERVFKGIRPVVVALIAVPVVRMARQMGSGILPWVIAAGTLVLVAFLKVSPIWVLAALAAAGAGVTLYRQRK